MSVAVNAFRHLVLGTNNNNNKRIYLLWLTSQLGQLNLASIRGRLIEYQLRLG